jgi:MraZ protein
MRFFTGTHVRSIDLKSRLQIPAPMRAVICEERRRAGLPEDKGVMLYVTLGEFPGTLSVLTEARFDELSQRIETEYMPGIESQRFELQFYSAISPVEMDKQGRIVLPDQLVKRAGLAGEVCVVGQKNRIEIWPKEAFKNAQAPAWDGRVSWEGDPWPDWQGFLRMRPGQVGRD